MNDKELELKVCEIFESIDVNICADEIEACHRLPYSKKEDRTKPKRTIVKFVNRKKCEQAIFNRKKLKVVDKTKLKFPEETQIFTTDSLCPYYRGIYGKCKKLYQLKKIFSFYNGIIRIKLEENGKMLSITHNEDLFKLFPKVQF